MTLPVSFAMVKTAPKRDCPCFCQVPLALIIISTVPSVFCTLFFARLVLSSASTAVFCSRNFLKCRIHILGNGYR